MVAKGVIAHGVRSDVSLSRLVLLVSPALTTSPSCSGIGDGGGGAAVAADHGLVPRARLPRALRHVRCATACGVRYGMWGALRHVGCRAACAPPSVLPAPLFSLSSSSPFINLPDLSSQIFFFCHFHYDFYPFLYHDGLSSLYKRRGCLNANSGHRCGGIGRGVISVFR